ncbi:MAG TPA: DUF5916 domain-containing protein [Vicinamibacterales bacterium]|nr:DUF5916 domain-containing protein [Vicinamibacterales bacterium]
MPRRRLVGLGALCLIAASTPVVAQGISTGPRLVIDGPPAPKPPDTITRDAAGRATVRAIKLSEPLRLDGRLDESVYITERPFGGLIQVAPRAGAPSTERTDVWVMYDSSHVYVTCRCWDSAPPDQWIVNELKRDTAGLRQNDHFGVMFDTFYDRRNGFMFYANPLGARADYSVIDEGQSNTDWNPVWDVRGGRFDGGWIVEMMIPFKSIRYRAGQNQIWGLQLRRSIRRKNEWAYLTPVPAFLAGPQALNRVSSGGTLVGLDLPEVSRNIDLKPYVIGDVTTDRQRTPPLSNDTDARAGFDVKYGVTANLTADFTVKTDFAQVEVDEQQINLTRFRLFFPEKRDFFLESRGVFDFGRGGVSVPGGSGSDSETPYLFYSRRIGFNANRKIPLDLGSRLTGKAGKYAIGVVAIRTGEEDVSKTPPTTFTVLRVKRDILRRSAVGAIFTDRTVGAEGSGRNRGYGVDAALSFFQNVRIGAYYAQTDTPDRTGDASSFQGTFSYSGDRYGLEAEHLKVGPDFNPEVGFLRRLDFEKSSATVRFSPRPTSLPAIRKFTWEAGVDFFENHAGVVESRKHNGRFVVEFESSDQFTLEVTRRFERLQEPFPIPPDLTVPVGDYRFWDIVASYFFGQHRRGSGTMSVTRGRFYDGTITAFGYTGGRVVLSNHLSIEPSLTVNKLDFPTRRVTQTLARTRADYAFTSRMFASALLQYVSSDKTFSSNLRYRWEYQPGSELFVVWTDERDTFPVRPSLRTRVFVIKITRLFRF